MQALEAELRRSVAGRRAEQQHAHEWEPWLVYADWLSAHDDPRGSLIVLEHRLASTRLGEAERARLRSEIDALVAEHRAAWTIEGLPASWGTVHRHGFLVGVALALDEESFEPLAELIADPRAALLTRLSATVDGEYDSDDYEDYEAEPEPRDDDLELFGKLLELDLSRIAHFAFEYRLLSSDAIAGLAPYLANFRTLDLRYAGVRDDALVRLCADAGPSVAGLEVVHLQNNYIGAQGLAALLDSDRARTLRYLDLRDNPLGPEGAKLLASAPLAQLDTLLLHQRDLGPEGTALLAHAHHLPLAIRRQWAGRASAQQATQP